MNKALKLLEELEKLIYVPNVDKEPQQALNGLDALNLINELRDEFKNISFQPSVSESLPRTKVKTLGHGDDCNCNHCQLLEKIFGNVR